MTNFDGKVLGKLAKFDHSNIWALTRAQTEQHVARFALDANMLAKEKRKKIVGQQI